MRRLASLFAIFAVIFTVALMVPGASKAGDLEIGGYVSIVAEGGDDANGNFRHDEDTFAIEEVEIDFYKELADGVAVTVDMQFLGAAGVTAGIASDLEIFDITGAPWGGGDTVQGSVDVIAFGIEQAFVTLPAGPVALQVGYFNIPIGLEGADKTDITTATHSLIFNFAVPTNGAGVMASFAPEGSPVNIDLYAINGWDSPFDNNSAKTIGGRIGLDLGEMANVGLSYITGREFDDSISFGPFTGSEIADMETTVMDIDLTITPMDALTLGFEYNAGSVDDADQYAATKSDAEWTAFTVQAHYMFNETCGLTVRLEEMDDEGGFLLGVDAKSGTTGATWESTTVALSHHIADGAELILEWREIEGDFDKTDSIFVVGGKDDTATTLVTAEFVYQF